MPTRRERADIAERRARRAAAASSARGAGRAVAGVAKRSARGAGRAVTGVARTSARGARRIAPLRRLRRVLGPGDTARQSLVALALNSSPSLLAGVFLGA